MNQLDDFHHKTIHLPQNTSLVLLSQYQVDSIDRIKVVDVGRKEGWVIDVDLYVNSSVLFFDDVLYHLHYELKKYIGMNSVNERNVIDIRESGPGIDW